MSLDKSLINIDGHESWQILDKHTTVDILPEMDFSPHLCLKWTSHHIFAFDVTLLQEIHSQNTNKTLVYIYQ
jgi:hypothetical protein